MSSSARKRRLKAYGILLGIALVLSLLPYPMFEHFMAPIPEGQRIAWREPGWMKVEKVAFDVLVAAPSLAGEAFGAWRTIYASFALPNSGGVHRIQSMSRAEVLGEHLKRALPFWAFALVGAYELVRLVRRGRVRVAA